jgi:phenylacetate-CoA ligase
MILQELVKRLPYPVKQGIKYAYGAFPPRLRYGRVFWKTYNFLQESQWWSRKRLEEYQMQQLSNLLHHAYENVPYYRRTFDEVGVKPKDIQDLNDLKKLPCLSKDTFRSQFDHLVAKNANTRKLPTSHTSGTAGKPLQFFQDPFASEKELAFIYHQWSRVGHKPGDARVELRGPVNRDKPVYYDPTSKVLRLSPLVESTETAGYYLKKIECVGADFLHGYPGAITSFAHEIRRNGLTVPFTLKAVLFASEAIYEWERELVQEVFQCRVFSHYGMAEQVVLAAECEHVHHYHCLPQYGITEIDSDTNEIIGTGFLNHANPFIRYRTTDVASIPISSNCDKCGRNYYPVFVSVQGRLGDFIVTPHGAWIAPAIITHPFKDLKTIKETQVIQKDLDLVIVRAVPREGSDAEVLRVELGQLCCDLKAIIGRTVQIKNEVVDEIERPSSGKFKWIVSEVCNASLEQGPLRE